ncbi:MAG: MFS transporter [Rhodocyclaceae bacterium]
MSEAVVSSPVAFALAYRRVLAMTAALFLSYLSVAMSLPAVSAHVVSQLGYGNGLAGLAVGIAFLSTILTRHRAGALADRRGGKYAMNGGLIVYLLAAVICAASSLPGLPVAASYGVLMFGRLVLGLGESLALVGMLGWSIATLGPANAGKAMALMGMGMYGAFAAGGPIGLTLYAQGGMSGLMLVCAVLPLAGLAIIRGLPAVVPPAGHRESLWQIFGRIAKPGAAVGLQGVGFAGLGAFFALYFAHQGWGHGELGLTGFGIGFVAVRILCGHLPDRIGGTPVAIGALIVEAIGQAFIWLSPTPGGALIGALLSGMGCSMVFPAMGVEVVKRVPPHLRGTALGGFAAFQDLAYGVTGPIAGLVADRAGYGSVFAIGTCAAVLGVAMAVWAHRSKA